VAPFVRYDWRADNWYFGDERRSHNGADSLVIKQRDLAETRVVDLMKAWRQAWEITRWPSEVAIDTAPDDEYDPREAIVGPVSFVLTEQDALALQCTITTSQFVEDEAGLAAELSPLVGPLLHRFKAQIAGIEVGRRTTAPYYHELFIVVPTRGKTLGDLYDVADSIVRLVEAADTGHLTRHTVVDLLAGGRADLLIGQPEGPWLDVKRAHYDLATPAGKISLAQAVSRFANAEEGGIVVVGMGTKKIRGGELIDSIRPVPVDTATVRRYRQAIETCLFPFPVGLEIRSVETSPGEGLILVSLPPQQEELKPFLVHGAIVGDRVEGAYISIVRRSGEDSIPITAQQIHSTLAAGRALLRRGYIRGETEESSSAQP
jgi:hypothetical protein